MKQSKTRLRASIEEVLMKYLTNDFASKLTTEIIANLPRYTTEKQVKKSFQGICRNRWWNRSCLKSGALRKAGLCMTAHGLTGFHL